MAKGHLSEDTINFIMTAESSQLQQEIHKSAKVIDDLKKKEADLRKEQAAVKTVLGEESKEYKDLQTKIKKVNQEIADENLKLTEMHKRLGTSSMTMTQLRKEAKQLQRQLDNTSQALNPEEYEAYASKLREIQQRIEELKNTAKGLSEQNQGGGFLSKFFGSKIDIGQLKTFLAGNAITKFAEITIESVAKVASRIKDLVAESVEAARAAVSAFQRRTGQLQAFADHPAPTVQITGGSYSVHYFIPLHLRFLDIQYRKNRKGRGKRAQGQHNLYNKLVWPILYQRVFPELKYGFTDEVRSQLRTQLEKALGAHG